jgi:hypothetical protein
MGFREKRREALEEREARKQANEEGWSGQQWEYLARNLDKVAGMVVEDDFNKRGRDGWEFVAEAKGWLIAQAVCAVGPGAGWSDDPAAASLATDAGGAASFTTVFEQSRAALAH